MLHPTLIFKMTEIFWRRHKLLSKCVEQRKEISNDAQKGIFSWIAYKLNKTDEKLESNFIFIDEKTRKGNVEPVR